MLMSLDPSGRVHVISPAALVIQAPGKLESRTGAVAYSQTRARDAESLLTK